MWFVFAVATTLLWGFAELFYKKGARPDERFSHLKIAVCVGAVMGLHAVYTLLTQNVGYDPVNLIRYLPVSLLYILSMVLSFFGMRFIEESISDPIENTSGAICTFLCFALLGEKIPFPSVCAISVMVVGILGIGFLEHRDESDRTKKFGKKTAAVAFAMPFLYALLDAFGSFLDIIYLDTERTPLVGVTEENIETVANTSYELTFAVCAAVLFVYILAKGEKPDVRRQGTKILSAVCETLGQFTYVFAMSGNGAFAAPIISASCVVALLLSRFILKERLTKKQYVFVGLVIAGIIALAVIEG